MKRREFIAGLGRGQLMKRRDFLFVAAMLAPAIRHASAQQPTTKKRLAVIVIGKVEDARIGPASLISSRKAANATAVQTTPRAASAAELAMPAQM